MRVDQTLHRRTSIITIKGHAACIVHGGQRARSGGGKYNAKSLKRAAKGSTLRNDDCTSPNQVFFIHELRETYMYIISSDDAIGIHKYVLHLYTALDTILYLLQTGFQKKNFQGGPIMVKTEFYFKFFLNLNLLSNTVQYCTLTLIQFVKFKKSF